MKIKNFISAYVKIIRPKEISLLSISNHFLLHCLPKILCVTVSCLQDLQQFLRISPWRPFHPSSLISRLETANPWNCSVWTLSTYSKDLVCLDSGWRIPCGWNLCFWRVGKWWWFSTLTPERCRWIGRGTRTIRMCRFCRLWCWGPSHTSHRDAGWNQMDRIYGKCIL